MASEEGRKLLNMLYYEDGMMFGRDKLYQYIRANLALAGGGF